ncbi:MAG: hypothetical protein ACI8ZM_003355 [Crocinitomix sp.]|jgi:uncharacterized protein YecE (DUF72 family)
MKFGKVDDPSLIDFTLPIDHPATLEVLKVKGRQQKVKIHVGYTKWNRTDLRYFYPPKTKSELAYYSQQFNSVEMNASFYRFFPRDQFVKWAETVESDFRFFPKVNQNISQYKRLKDCEALVDEYVDGILGLEDKLGGVFLQMMQNFAPKDFERVQHFVEYWPKSVPIAIEFRHTDWYNDATLANELYHLFESNGICNNLTDTPGRRDLMHMRLTNKKCFVRWVSSANHELDHARLDEWVERVKEWTAQGLEEFNFFVHENMPTDGPMLSTYFVEALNKGLGLNLNVPRNLYPVK